MIACPYCFNQLRISTAMEQLIGKVDLAIECSSCGQTVIYKNMEPKKYRLKSDQATKAPN